MAEKILMGVACFILWGLAFAILATTPMVVQDSDGKCVKVVPSSAGSCEALPERYEVIRNSK